MALAAISAVLCACTGDPAARDLNDTTAPTMTLKLTASSTVPSGLADLALGTNDTLTGAGGSLFIVADNGKGVSWVELWMTTTRDCGGVIDGPGLAGAPAKRVTGNVSSTSAPSSLSAGLDINTLGLQSGCTFVFDVWGKAANAATTPVVAQSQHSHLTFAAP
jgi:hypothetical protein